MPQSLRIGPKRCYWQGQEPAGTCPDCGGQCAPECGKHPAGCIYGGFSANTAYWLIASDCPLYHGEETHP